MYYNMEIHVHVHVNKNVFDTSDEHHQIHCTCLSHRVLALFILLCVQIIIIEDYVLVVYDWYWLQVETKFLIVHC